MGCGSSTEITDIHKFKRKLQRSFSHYSMLGQGDDKYIDTGKQKLKYEVKITDDFLTHHLANQQPLSSHTSTHKIRARQILEHYLFKDAFHKYGKNNMAPSKLTEFAVRAWLQRTFVDILDRVQMNFLDGSKSYDETREQLAEQYVFQIYQLMCFLNAGYSRFSTATKHMELPLAPILTNSDTALYFILGKLQKRYPLVSEEQNLTFPQVQSTTTTLNLLSLIDSKAYSDPDNFNFQTTMDDLKILFDQANSLFDDFKTDMKDLLGDVSCDCKVKWQDHEGQTHYNASAVRRVFIKWTQTLIERIPDVCSLKEFVDFVRSKQTMADAFIFKSTVTPTTHQQVIDQLSSLIQAIKYKVGSKEPRDDFGLFLYDLLRSKTTRNTGQEVVELYQKLKNTSKTKTGKKFSVIRVKNRFKKSTRDLLVNFRYGQHLVAQVQLCVDIAETSPQAAKKNKMGHLLYELERGLFGPTFELIMQLQDFTRKDIVVRLQAQGLIKQRQICEHSSLEVKYAGRKCPQKHEMIATSGDLFGEDKFSGLADDEQKGKVGTCDFCFKNFSLNSEYHYCYYCSIFYCLKCINQYKSVSQQNLQLSCLDHDKIIQIQSQQALEELCKEKKSIIVVFYQQGPVTSQLFTDQIVYLLGSYLYQKKQIPEIYKINTKNKQFEAVLKKYQIERTPTTVIFNNKQQSQVVLIGASFRDVQGILQVKERIFNGLPKGLKMKCKKCDQNMNTTNQPKEDEKCQNCMDMFKIGSIMHMLKDRNIKVSDFSCKNGHLTCSFCSYLSSDHPSLYRDYTGRTYLSSQLLDSQLQCSNNHPMDLIPAQQYNCKTCSKSYSKNNSSHEQIGCCFKCEEYKCIDCSSQKKPSFLSKISEDLMDRFQIAFHFAQYKLEEGYPCGCGKYFWRAYQSPKISQSRNKLLQLLDPANTWKCRLCNKQQHKLRLHLGCFYCSYAKQRNGEVSHTQICLECAIKSGLLGRQSKQKVKKQATDLLCPSNHAVVFTSIRTKGQLSYRCYFCNQNYHPCTQRYQCQACNSKFCLKCQQQLRISEPPSTSMKCNQGHSLELVRHSPKLQFCSLCYQYIEGRHFQCPHPEDRYFLCLSCADKDKQKDKSMTEQPQ